MKTIKLTQGQVTLVDDIDYEYLSQWKWYANWDLKHFRAMRNLSKVNGKRKTMRMHTIIAQRMGIDSKMIDHIDHNSLNNQRSNLRVATGSQNQHNRGCNKNNTSGVKGVFFHKGAGRYRAHITHEGRQHYLGLFDTIAEAEVVVVAKREELVGEFACN